MTLKELKQIKETLIDLYDFFAHNASADESGLRAYINESFQESVGLVEKEQYRLHLRNALSCGKRKIRNSLNSK